jgi:hypothetical protein
MDHEFKASLGYIMMPYFKTQKEEEKKEEENEKKEATGHCYIVRLSQRKCF